MQVLLFTGRAGSGKSTVTQLVERAAAKQGRTVIRASLAGPLRQVCSEIFPWVPDIHFYGTKEQKESPILGMPEGWTGRRVLQHIGTEGVRAIHPEAWIKLLEHRIHQERERCPGGVFTVDDVRFPNEASILRQYGPLYRITREEAGVVGYGASHESEVHIDQLEVDGEIVNDGSLDDLYDVVRGLLGQDRRPS